MSGQQFWHSENRPDAHFVRLAARNRKATESAERRKPELIKATRKRRIAAGAGVHVQEVNRLLKEFEQMQGMMKKMKGGGLMKMMKRMGGMKGMPKLPGMG